MTAALRTLLTGVLDYAGLFPPASITLDDAIRNYAGYLKSPDRWMLSRFICPTARLAELPPYLDQLGFSGLNPLTIAALGKPGEAPFDLVANLESDLAAIRAFREIAGERAVVDVIETRAFGGSAENREIAAHIAGSLNAAGLHGFLEVPWIGSTAELVSANARLFAEHALGFKLRPGGRSAEAFPAAGVVARTIVACRDAACPLKFTAGLHHPLRAFNTAVNTTMHGFINVFASGVLAHTHGMDEHAIAEVLNTENGADFTFDEYGLRWKTLNATRQRIEQTRAKGLMSFGSCSFDEPRDDLRALGWM